MVFLIGADMLMEMVAIRAVRLRARKPPLDSAQYGSAPNFVHQWAEK
jgi:hypothetical protein